MEEKEEERGVFSRDTRGVGEGREGYGVCGRLYFTAFDKYEKSVLCVNTVSENIGQDVYMITRKIYAIIEFPLSPPPPPLV